MHGRLANAGRLGGEVLTQRQIRSTSIAIDHSCRCSMLEVPDTEIVSVNKRGHLALLYIEQSRTSAFHFDVQQRGAIAT